MGEEVDEELNTVVAGLEEVVNEITPVDAEVSEEFEVVGIVEVANDVEMLDEDDGGCVLLIDVDVEEVLVFEFGVPNAR